MHTEAIYRNRVFLGAQRDRGTHARCTRREAVCTLFVWQQRVRSFGNYARLWADCGLGFVPVTNTSGFFVCTTTRTSCQLLSWSSSHVSTQLSVMWSIFCVGGLFCFGLQTIGLSVRLRGHTCLSFSLRLGLMGCCIVPHNDSSQELN